MRAVSAAGVEKVDTVRVAASAPADHLAAGPYCRGIDSGNGRISEASGCPTVRASVISTACVKSHRRAVAESAPNDHFTPAPHGRVIGSASGRVSDAGSCPTIGAWVVSSARVQTVVRDVKAAPDHHFAAAPDPGVTVPANRGVGRAGGDPAIRYRIIFAPGVQKDRLISSTPDDHFTASPHCRVTPSALGHAGRAGGGPSVSARVISTAGVKPCSVISPTPDDHLTAAPDCRVRFPCRGCVVGGDTCPTIDDWIVSAAGVGLPKRKTITFSAPNNHLIASPYSDVQSSVGRCVYEARRCPTVSGGTISAAGVQTIGG